MSRGVQINPYRPAKGANMSGPSENPIDPAVMWNAIADAFFRSSEMRWTVAAAGGWNAAPPSPPRISTAASIQTFVVRPIRLKITTAHTGPTRISIRGRQRSATWPKPSCATELAI